MDDAGVFYVHLMYFTAIWYTLWPFSIFYGYLIYFSRLGILSQEKYGNAVLVVSRFITVPLCT
jgi:hypothetical protein